jgi:hypothetical protein
MIDFMTVILDFKKAIAMQISIWWWEMHMIAKYGLDRGYRDPWERL